MNMKALISTTEPVESGYRVAQVEPDNAVFPVAETLFWVDCADDIVAGDYWYDHSDHTIKPIAAIRALSEQPVVSGAQTL